MMQYVVEYEYVVYEYVVEISGCVFLVKLKIPPSSCSSYAYFIMNMVF